MKQKTNSSIVVIGLILGLGCPNLVNAQSNQGALSYLIENKTEEPKTSAEKLAALKKRHQDAFSEFTLMLNRLPVETDLLGSKELFTQIDKTDRDMKNIHTSCGSFMTSLRASAKNIQDNKSFSDDQKKELLEAAEGLDKECKIISDLTDLASQQLSKAYATARNWKTIHKTYFDLQGKEKAAEQVKTHVEEYLQSFTPAEKPEAVADSKDENPSDPSEADNEVVE